VVIGCCDEAIRHLPIILAEADFDREAIFSREAFEAREAAIEDLIRFREIKDSAFQQKARIYKLVWAAALINQLAIEYWEDVNCIVWGYHPGTGMKVYITSSSPRRQDNIDLAYDEYLEAKAEYEYIRNQTYRKDDPTDIYPPFVYKPYYEDPTVTQTSGYPDPNPYREMRDFLEDQIQAKSSGWESAKDLATIMDCDVDVRRIGEEDQNMIISGINPDTGELLHIRQTAPRRLPQMNFNPPVFPPNPPFGPGGAHPHWEYIHWQLVVHSWETVKTGAIAQVLYTNTDAESSDYDSIPINPRSFGSSYDPYQPSIHSVDRLMNIFEDHMHGASDIAAGSIATAYLLTGNPLYCTALAPESDAADLYQELLDPLGTLICEAWYEREKQTDYTYRVTLEKLNATLKRVVETQFLFYPQVKYIPVEDILSRRNESAAAFKRFLRYTVIMSRSEEYADSDYHIPGLIALIHWYCLEYGIIGAADTVHVDSFMSRHTKDAIPLKGFRFNFDELKEAALDDDSMYDGPNNEYASLIPNLKIIKKFYPGATADSDDSDSSSGSSSDSNESSSGSSSTSVQKSSSSGSNHSSSSRSSDHSSSNSSKNSSYVSESASSSVSRASVSSYAPTGSDADSDSNSSSGHSESSSDRAQNFTHDLSKFIHPAVLDAIQDQSIPGYTVPDDSISLDDYLKGNYENLIQKIVDGTLYEDSITSDYDTSSEENVPEVPALDPQALFNFGVPAPESVSSGGSLSDSDVSTSIIEVEVPQPVSEISESTVTIPQPAVEISGSIDEVSQSASEVSDTDSEVSDTVAVEPVVEISIPDFFDPESTFRDGLSDCSMDSGATFKDGGRLPEEFAAGFTFNSDSDSFYERHGYSSSSGDAESDDDFHSDAASDATEYVPDVSKEPDFEIEDQHEMNSDIEINEADLYDDFRDDDYGDDSDFSDDSDSDNSL
jgi:hypothetical protein